MARRGPVFCDLVCDMSRWHGFFATKWPKVAVEAKFEGRLFALPHATVMRCRWEIFPPEGAARVVEHPENGQALWLRFKGAREKGAFKIDRSPAIWAFDGKKVLVAVALPPLRSEVRPEWKVEGEEAVLTFKVITGMSLDRRLELRAWVALADVHALPPKETARRLALSLTKMPLMARVEKFRKTGG